MVFDLAIAKITVEQLAHASSMWWQTYMSAMVMASATSTAEQVCHDTTTIDSH